MKDYTELVRKSIRKDFNNANFKRNGRAPKTPHPANTKRVLSINENCSYYQHRKFFIGKLIRIVRKSPYGIWVGFVNDNDRVALNKAAGWSDNKCEYLLMGAKFDD